MATAVEVAFGVEDQGPESANLDAATVEFLNEVSSARCLKVVNGAQLTTLDYVEYLDIDLSIEPHLVWVAREMCAAPMPKNAEVLVSKSGIVYFHDTYNDYYTLEHPLTQRYLKVLEKSRIDSYALRSRPAVDDLIMKQPDILFHAQFKHIQLPCQDCAQRQSTIHCDQCLQSFCDGCYQTLHNNSSIRKFHQTRQTAVGSVCSSCSNKKPQTFCSNCEDYFCFDCFEQLHKRGFRTDHKAVLVAASDGDIIEDNVKCDECLDSRAALTCDYCQDKFCVLCFWKCHLNGNRRKHTATKTSISPLCSHCILTRATVFCEQCQEIFCTDCFTARHQKGGRQLHLFSDAMNVLVLLEKMDPSFVAHMDRVRPQVVYAISKIQAWMRGVLIRKQFHRRKEIVTKIQRRWRGASTRRKLLSMLDHLKWRKKQFASYFLPKTRQERLVEKQRFVSQFSKRDIATKSATEVLQDLKGTILSTAAADPLEDPVRTNQKLQKKEQEMVSDQQTQQQQPTSSQKTIRRLTENNEERMDSVFQKSNEERKREMTSDISVRQLLKIDDRLDPNELDKLKPKSAK